MLLLWLIFKNVKQSPGICIRFVKAIKATTTTTATAQQKKEIKQQEHLCKPRTKGELLKKKRKKKR